MANTAALVSMVPAHPTTDYPMDAVQQQRDAAHRFLDALSLTQYEYLTDQILGWVTVLTGDYDLGPTTQEPAATLGEPTDLASALTWLSLE